VPSVTAADGAQIFYKDWGDGQPVVFSHGWPLSADAWDNQLDLVASAGYRAIAHDRRGHGRSTQTWDGNTMDRYADDLAALIDHLDLADAVLVGHSAGGGEVVRYLGRHGTGRVGKVVLLESVTPGLLQTPANPHGSPIDVFDQTRADLAADRSQFFKDLAVPFYGADRVGAKVSQGVLEHFWLLCMQVGLKAAYDGIRAFSEYDFTDDLATIDVPTLVVHCEDDEIVPLAATAPRTASMLSDATLKIYPAGSHGLIGEFEAQFNHDLLNFIKA
jgi:non-heme chloroperoxidase